MPGQLPTDPRAVLTFVAAHTQAWAEHAAAIGITPQQAAAVEDRLDEARAALRRVEALRSEAQAATASFNAAAQALRDSAAAVVRTARTTATNTDNPAVYTLALLEPPAPPRRSVGPPTAPLALAARLIADSGAIELTWKSRQPRGVRGVVFQVFRSEGGRGGGRAGRFIGLTGERRFLDDRLPPGLARGGDLSYTVVPVRAGDIGPSSAVLTVRVGTIRDDAAPSVKLAA